MPVICVLWQRISWRFAHRNSRRPFKSIPFWRTHFVTPATFYLVFISVAHWIASNTFVPPAGRNGTVRTKQITNRSVEVSSSSRNVLSQCCHSYRHEFVFHFCCLTSFWFYWICVTTFAHSFVCKFLLHFCQPLSFRLWNVIRHMEGYSIKDSKDQIFSYFVLPTKYFYWLDNSSKKGLQYVTYLYLFWLLILPSSTNSLPYSFFLHSRFTIGTQTFPLIQRILLSTLFINGPTYLSTTLSY